MPDPQDRMAPPARPSRFGRVVIVGLYLVWFVAVVADFWRRTAEEASAAGLLIMILMAVLPAMLMWPVVTALHSARELRAEAARLRAAVDEMRASRQQAQPGGEGKPDGTLPTATKTAEPALAIFSTRRDIALSQPSADRKAALANPVRSGAEDQPALALGTPTEDLRAPLLITDFIRALQFPETPDDREGFRALRLALEDRTIAKLIRAAQDVLTLLSQEGIFMDDLKPDRARPELWRSFARGERGRVISGLGGIRDRSSLALTAGRMREDPIFRDAAHHFLRTFDRTFAEFEYNASDVELIELADTRTARAFMLFGRVAGVFD